MKVLWIVNTVFPDLAKKLGQNVPVVGGWMYGLAKDLSIEENMVLAVATARDASSDLDHTINNIRYFTLKGSKSINKYDKSLENKWKEIIELFEPDVVHIHGTEYSHGLALMQSLPNLNYVISIQGLVGIYSRYFFAGITIKEVLKSITIRDILKRDTLLHGKKEFYKRGRDIESRYIKNTKHVIGRTQWDKDHTKTVNPKLHYHFCNESLRDNFYESEKWNLTHKNDYSIFLSQGGRPLKGVHVVLEALVLLKEEFPNLKMKIAGNDITYSKEFKDVLRIGGYGKYIKNKIKKNKLDDVVSFTGPLSKNEMALAFKSSHVFICPSSIENSPNSIGEAQILGVPVVASYVGGVPNMIEHGKTGLLYRFEEVEMLAQAIKAVFLDDTLANKLSINGIIEAEKRHDREINLKKLMQIYREISIS